MSFVSLRHLNFLLGGGSLAANARCNPYLFEGRRQLFQQAQNLLIVPGDNDWNECSDYRIDENTSPSRGEWRDKFTTAPFDAFTKPFPDGTFPNIVRKTGQYADAGTGDENPEIYYFEYDKIAFFGLNRPARESYISDRASMTITRSGQGSSLQKMKTVHSSLLVRNDCYPFLRSRYTSCLTVLASLIILYSYIYSDIPKKWFLQCNL